MLTLGLMEGVLSAMVGILVLVGAANENAPLHRVFGPLVVLTVGLGAYGIHAAGVVTEASDVIGLLFFALISFFVPVAIMRAAWKMGRALDGAPAKERGRPARPVVRTRAEPVHETPEFSKVA